MKLAKGYRRSWHLKIFLFLALVAILLIGAEEGRKVGSHLGNIPVMFETHWPKGSGGVSI